MCKYCYSNLGANYAKVCCAVFSVELNTLYSYIVSLYPDSRASPRLLDVSFWVKNDFGSSGFSSQGVNSGSLF